MTDGRPAVVAVFRADCSVLMEQKCTGQQNWARCIFCFFLEGPRGKTAFLSKESCYPGDVSISPRVPTPEQHGKL